MFKNILLIVSIISLFVISGCDKKKDASDEKKITLYSYTGEEGGNDLRAWHLDDEMISYIDVHSLKRNGDIVEFTGLSNYRGNKLEQVKTKFGFQSYKTWTKVNCVTKSFIDIKNQGFSELFLKGDAMAAYDTSNVWEKAEPGTSGEGKVERACAMAPTSAAPAPEPALAPAPAPEPAQAPNSSGSSPATEQNDAYRMMVARAVNELGPDGYAKCASATITMLALRARGDNLGRLAPNVDPMVGFMSAVRTSLISKGNPESLLDKLMKNADQIMMSKNDPVLAAMQDFDKCYIDAIR